MVLYGLILYVLEDQIRAEYTVLLQSRYSDDFSMAGARAHLKPLIYHIEALRRAHGLFLEL